MTQSGARLGESGPPHLAQVIAGRSDSLPFGLKGIGGTCPLGSTQGCVGPLALLGCGFLLLASKIKIRSSSWASLSRPTPSSHWSLYHRALPTQDSHIRMATRSFLVSWGFVLFEFRITYKDGYMLLPGVLGFCHLSCPLWDFAPMPCPGRPTRPLTLPQ